MEQDIPKDVPVIWVHAASLGEYEQGLPVLKRIRAEYPQYKLLLTFFSPSGYEAKRANAAADWVYYLPLDTRGNVSRFLDLSSPRLAIFVKYEVWPNYLRELEKRHIPSLLISARFKPQQVFFKGYGGFMRKALKKFDHFFVQDQESAVLLATLGIRKVTLSGDTRFDRVSEILERENHLDFMHSFAEGHLCLVAGSTWPEDEGLLVAYINGSDRDTKFVLVPHDLRAEHLNRLCESIRKKWVLYSASGDQNLQDYRVLIVDTIGMLTRIYSYADIAYVGGGFATGLHNTLEPAAFGIPVLIGPRYEGFREARELVTLGGIKVVQDATTLEVTLNRLLGDPTTRKQAGDVNAAYVHEHKGASAEILRHIGRYLKDDPSREGVPV